jgi:hypothetical protein
MLLSMLRRFFLLSSAALLGACSSGSNSTTNEPGMLGRMWATTQRLNPMQSKLKPREMKQLPPPDLRTLAPTLAVDPPTPKLAEIRLLKVTLRLVNRGKHLAHLDFPTTQRIDAVIKDKTGRVIERWSEYQRFENEPGLVAVNPGERLEYSANVATRDMKPDEPFTVEAWISAYDTLRASATVTPVK